MSQLHSEAEQLAAATADINEAHLVNEAALIPCREQEQALAVQVQAQLTALGETMPGKGKEDAFLTDLTAAAKITRPINSTAAILLRRWPDWRADTRLTKPRSSKPMPTSTA